MVSSNAEARGELFRLFYAALARVEGGAVVRRWLQERTTMRGNWHVVAIGKAAASMAAGAEAALGTLLRGGLIITKQANAGPEMQATPRWRLCLAEHPVPGPGSLAAGHALLGFIAGLPVDARLLFLLSGGASSLVEVLPTGFGLDDLRRANAWLLGSGLDIGDVNRVRQRLSLIKGGRLRACLGARQARVLAISDVAGDDVRALGSGLLADPLPGPLPPLPDWLADWTARAAPVAGADRPIVPHDVVASVNDALQAAAEAAAAAGLVTHAQGASLYGDTAETGQRIGRQLRYATPGVWLWGGETTICLPQRPGRGGRNQHLALAAAVALDGAADAALLAAGTDGTDGPTDDAGAIVDGGTVARGQGKGLDARVALATADAGTFLDASGDLLSTGPTGTNVTDLVIGLKWGG